MRLSPRRILGWTGVGLLSLVVVLVLLAAFVAGTTPGGRLLIAQVLPRLPVEAEVGHFDGRLAGRFRLLGTRVAMPGLEVSVDTLEVRWRPRALIGRHLAVERVFAGGVVADVSPVPADSAVVARDTSTAGTLDLPVRVTLGGLRARRIAVTLPGLRVDDATATAAGSPDAYRVGVTARISGESIPDARVAASIDGNLSGARLQRLDVAALDGQVLASGKGAWSPRVEWDLALQARDINPAPLLGDTVAWDGRISTRLLTRGAITDAGPEAFVAIDSLEGDVRDYRLLGAGRLDVTATGARIETLELAWGPLDVRIGGEASWSPEVEWAVDLSVDSLDSSLFLPDSSDVAGVVYVRGSTTGSMTRAGPDGSSPVVHAAARLDSIAGEINGREVRGHGDVRVDDRTLTVSALELSAGSNHLSATGTLSEDDVDIRLQARVDDPSAVLAGAYGRLGADVSAKGPPRRPDLSAQITADSAGYRDYSVRRARIQSDARLGSGGGVGGVISVDGVEAAGKLIDSVRVNVRGNVEAHDLNAVVHADSFVSLSLALSGGLFEERWSGDLRQLEISEAHAGKWTLRDSVAISAGASGASLGSMCLARDDGARVCASGLWSEQDSSRARLEIHELPLAMADTLLAGAHLAGVLNARVDADISGAGDLRADGQLSFDGVELQPADSTLATIRFDSMEVALRVDELGADARMRMLVTQGGKIRSDVRGSASLDGYNNLEQDARERPLDARVDAQFADLAFVGAASSSLKDVRGALRLSGSATGTIATPEAQVELHLENAAVRLPELGIHVRDINLDASGKPGQGLHMEGQLRSGRGTIRVLTETRMVKGGTPEARVQVRGDHFRAVNTTEATVDISPSLDLSLVERRIDLKGDVGVPFAKIEIVELPENAVRPSRDVVFIDVEEERRTPIRVAADVRVVLGDSISFRGLGAVGKFKGSLRVVERPGRPTAATGELRFVDAQYTFLGQRLIVDPGRVFFAGGPLENPGLDIRAYRDLDNGRVKAGVHVRGTAKNPVTTVFSIPSMSQANAMSYLLTGRGIEEGGDQSDVMMATALTMGLQQGNTMTGGIGSSLGLDTASFEAGETVEETSFVAGKYLSPSLYVSYGIGVFDRIGSWKMRYSLTRRVTVQTETGRESGADLFYKFERGGTRQSSEPPDEKTGE